MITGRIGRSLVLVMLLFPLLVGVTTAKALSNCSLETLKGTYGALEQGTVVAPPPAYPVATSATPTYDGAGNLSGTFTGSFGGAITPGTSTGTYTVNPDCTYSDEFTVSPGSLVFHHAGTITGGGILQEIHYIYTDPGLVVSGTAKKTLPGRCSLATLRGTYALFGQGTITAPIPGLPPPPFPVVQTAIVTFDGKGSLSGGGTRNVGGVAGPGTFTGTYTVNADCTASFVVTPSTGPAVVHETGAITGAGIFQEVHSIVTDAGFVLAHALKKQ